jgi:transposase
MWMVAECSDCQSQWSAMARIAPLLGVATAEMLRKWVRRSQADSGVPAGCNGREVP